MQQEKLRELAVILTERVQKNTSIDWTIKESVRAKLRVIVKRTLKQYYYPSDMRQLATDLVIKQAEWIAGGRWGEAVIQRPVKLAMPENLSTSKPKK